MDSDIPPLVDLKITNPITYLKAWWKKVIGNEGIKLTLQIKPLTAIALTVVVSGIGFGLGRITLPAPIVHYIPILQPPAATPTPSPWRETAFTGKLQVSGTRYYLLTTSAEAITLEVPGSINLAKLVGKRIMAAGSYNKGTRTLVVTDAADLEILPSSPVSIPTANPHGAPPAGTSPSTEPTPQAML